MITKLEKDTIFNLPDVNAVGSGGGIMDIKKPNELGVLINMVKSNIDTESKIKEILKGRPYKITYGEITLQ